MSQQFVAGEVEARYWMRGVEKGATLRPRSRRRGTVTFPTTAHFPEGLNIDNRGIPAYLPCRSQSFQDLTRGSLSGRYLCGVTVRRLMPGVLLQIFVDCMRWDTFSTVDVDQRKPFRFSEASDSRPPFLLLLRHDDISNAINTRSQAPPGHPRFG